MKTITTKKSVTRRLLPALLALALTLALCLGGVASVFAGYSDPGTVATPAKAVVKKVLKVPYGTTVPTVSYTFSFSKVKFNDSTATADINKLPNLGPVTVAFSSADTGPSMGGITSIPKESGNILDDKIFPETGVYEYTVTESAISLTPGTGETMYNSQAAYTFKVYVAVDGETRFVQYVEATMTHDDNGNAIAAGKTDPSPGKGGMAFTNRYIKNEGGDITDPTEPSGGGVPLKVSKTITGNGADPGKYFEFTIKAVKPSILDDPTPTTPVTYKAYVVSGGAVVTPLPVDNYKGTSKSNDAHGDYILFTSGTTDTVYLKGGQHLAFVNTHVGTTYSAIETGATGYTPSVTITTSGSAVGPNSAAAGTSLSTDIQYVGMGTNNSAAFTNTRISGTPTGIVIDNLPYIGLIALAAGGLAIFLAMKRRRRSRYAMAEQQQ
jgi:hypothetical protein